VVPLVCIEEAQGFIPYGRVDHLIDARQEVRHLGSSLVQACVVHAHALGPVLLPHENRVCYPLRVEHLLDEPSRQEPSDLLADFLPLLLVEASQALLGGSGRSVGCPATTRNLGFYDKPNLSCKVRNWS
jgi:hypothetical protein